jgi:hypothetical protein
MGIDVPERIFSDLRIRLGETLARILVAEGLPLPVPLERHGAELTCRDCGPVKVLHIIEDEDADHPTIRLEDIIIAEASRGAGHGTAIVRTAHLNLIISHHRCGM